MELSILYAIPRFELLDSFFLILTKIAGSYGQLCLVTGILLTVFRKTRRTGIAVLIAYVGVLVFGQLILKNLIDRPRPCHIDQAFALLVNRPTSSSFPSTHSAWAFGAATAIFLRYRKAGTAAFVVAACIAFSRMYLFLHFPTDVLCGAALGAVLGIAATKIIDHYPPAGTV
ncbi:MAG: phosphatase PAP2 family protein [Lachnospiraceae bacterium]|nr:phosphatase PAP2 family protein [Lachnospiraceae bacterium]